ncbi:hypothetical protein CDV31_005034 [Fusarium ambrosium]|uniref:Clr5 domain-containing protein n=1 Tax=Fusarium ambrosium TaxID=131363 RepID=A0A428UM96_9HYPO|nr:hypothetical protein CDV31_005034 [Fusarium ambrosium]
MAIDWKPYEREVNRWYLHEGKTANEVIQLLLGKYNLEVTHRQFKAKFGGCKKISSKEWSILIPKIREREANGLKSVIYVCGKAIKHESMARSIRRYSKLCRDSSQSEATVDIGIDTVGQHRIEIRAPSEPGAQLLWDFSIAEVQPSNEGENSSNSQSDEVDVDEEFGPVEMDVEPSAGNAICASPSIFLGSLDQLPPNLLETLSFNDAHGMQMESDGTALPLSPSLDLTTLVPFQHPFKSFWDSPDIFGLTLKGCEAAVDIAKRIGIFAPNHSRHKSLPKLDISPSQAAVLNPVIQSIEELLTPPESKIPGVPRTRLVDRAQLNFPPTLLDVMQGDSLAQALSVIVYMISNNLLGAKESLRLICWILKRGHVPNLLTFSRRPAVQHLAFGPAFLRAIAKTADRLLSSSAEAISLIGDFVSSINRLNSTDSFLLHELLDCGQLDCLDLALQTGARTEDKYEGMTLLQLAVLKKDSDAIQFLLQHGAQINGCPRSVGGDTMVPEMLLPSPIRSQDIYEYKEPTKHMLLSHVDSSGFVMGVFADKESYFPHTPLQLASSSKDPDFGIVEFLLRQGADVNAPAAEWYGRTALQGATSAEKLNMEVVDLLLSEGADVNAPPAHVGGVTALQGAAIRGNIQLVKLLIDKSAQIDAPGAHKEGRTALEGAAEQGRMEMLRFLLSKGAIPDFVTGYSRAIELAEKELHLGVAKFLREEQRKLHEMGWGLGTLGLDLDPL